MALFALVLLLAPPGWSGPTNAQGQRDGEWIRRSTRGVKLEAARYANGQRDGAQTVYKADGSTCWTGTFTAGTGTLEQYTADCRLKARAQYQAGRLHGTREQFDRTGRKVSQGAYAYGLAHGMHIRWRYPTKGEPKLTFRCMFAGRAIWRSVHGGPVDECTVDTLAGTGIWRSALFRRTKKGVPVEQLFSRGPGKAAGVQVGDVIVAIDKRRLPGPGPEAMHRAITGPPGSTVVLTVRRGETEIEIPVVRQPLDLKAWAEEMEAEARAKVKKPVELLKVPEPRFPGRGM